MSEIQLLTSEVQRLGPAYNWWANASLWLVGITAATTVLYFVASYKALRTGTLLKEKQDTLSAAKDAQSRERIANVEAEARQKIAALTNEAEQAKKGIAVAKAEAAKANEKAETEALTRIELEEAIAPRTLVATNKTFDRLRRFKGTPYIIEFSPDAEAERTAGQIGFILRNSEWNPLSFVRTFARTLPDGVSLDFKRPEKGVNIFNTPPGPATFELRDLLEANGLQVSAGPWERSFGIEEVPVGAIRISVGFKSTLYLAKNL